MARTLVQEALHVRKLKRDLKEKKDKADEAKRKHDEAERHLIQRMEGEGCDSISADHTLFVPTRTVYGQINDRDEFVSWAAENDESLVETKERKGLINELVRERLDNGEELPPGLTFRVDEYVSQRAA